MAAITQAEYDAWNDHSKDFSEIGDASKNLLLEDPAKQGRAREDLESLIKKYDSLLVFGRHDVDSHVLKHLQPAQQHFAHESLKAFVVDPQGMIDYVYKAKDGAKKFAENYRSIDPTLIRANKDGKAIQVPISFGKDKKADLIPYIHSLYFQLNQYVEGKKEATTLKDLATVTTETSKLFEESLALHYQLRGIDEATAKRRAKLVRESYDTSTPQEAYPMLAKLTSRIKENLERAVPEDKRAEYALSLLKAKTSNSKDLANIEIASRELYKIAK